MPRPTPKRTQAEPRQASSSQRRPQPNPPEVVDPRWLLKAIGLTIVAAMLCAYLAVCVLVEHGSWQLFLHPGKTVTQTPAAAGIPFDPIHFDAGTTGIPRLTGWWIPGPDPASATTILVLHDGSGTLSATLPRLAILHASGVNLFAFDPRGFGQSSGPHPTEASMAQDAAAALTYLTSTRHIPPSSIVPLGIGLGASLAAGLAAEHPELPAVILDNPDPGATLRPILNSQAHLLPMHLLVGDQFDVSAQVARAKQAKLLLRDDLPPATPHAGSHDKSTFPSAPPPKMTVTLPDGAPQSQYVDAIRRFLDEYVSTRH